MLFVQIVMKKNYIFALLTVSVWSTLAAITKMLLTDIPNLEALAISSFFAFLFLFMINVKNKTAKELKRLSIKDYLITSSLGFLGLFVYSALYNYGLTQLTSQEACILNYLWPIMLVLFSSIILGEKLTFVKCAAMLFSFAGVIVLSTGNGNASSGNALFGMISCIVAAACYGLFSVLNKKTEYNPNISMMIMWLTVSVCSSALGLFTEEWVMIKGIQWLGLLWLGVVVDALAYLLWAKALKGASDSSKIANLAYLTPFLSIIVSAIVLHEEITLRAFIALLFIVGGILLPTVFGLIKKKQ